jgi:DNA-binding transcriptional LysR family regulator
MINWDDVRYFLAVARDGSVRAAASRLKVNHSTVLRRIAQLEEQLGSSVFEKLPSGYRLTEAGEEVLELAAQMEASSNELESRIFGRDQSIRGTLRIALPPSIATHLLMPDFTAFSEKHPEIAVVLLSSYEPVNLMKRQADLAIRVVYKRDALPPDLYGTKINDLHGGVYISRRLLDAFRGRAVASVRWVLRADDDDVPDWAREGDVVSSTIPFKVTDPEAQLVAVQLGTGMAPLPCFIGDADPLLTRVPGSRLRKHGTLWLLTHRDARKTKRVRLFSEFIARRLAAHEALLVGMAGASS